VATLVISGQPSPDGVGAIGSPGLASLNDVGQVAFVDTQMSGSGGNSSDQGVFRAGQGGLQLLVREGQAAPGGGTFGPFLDDFPALNNAGLALGALRISGASDSDEGIYRMKPGLLEPVVREGDPAPGGGTLSVSLGMTFQDALTSPAINAAGQTAFLAPVSSTSGQGNAGIFRGNAATILQPASVVPIARVGQTEPAGEGTFSAFHSISLGSGGQVGFAAGLFNAVSPGTIDQGIFRGDGFSVTEIARTGRPAAGAGMFGGTLAQPAMNDLGQVAFIGSLEGTGQGNVEHTGIFRGNGFSLDRIAVQGDAAPDGNGVFGGFAAAPAINNAGQVAFVAPITQTAGGDNDNEGVFLFHGSSLMQIAREGQEAPGGGSFTGFGSLGLNIAGNMAFEAAVSHSGGPDRAGLFYYGVASGLREIAREGLLLEGSAVTGGLTFAGSTGPSGIWRSGLNNNNQLAFPFVLADGRRGIALWTPDVVLPTLQGDYNNGRRVEQGDLDLVLLNWGNSAIPAPSGWTNDLPVGVIDQQELDKVLLGWGRIRAGRSIPEPDSKGLAVLLLCFSGGIALLRSRRCALIDA
jgi:hypothetical protein